MEANVSLVVIAPLIAKWASTFAIMPKEVRILCVLHASVAAFVRLYVQGACFDWKMDQ
jgi:hypothetical protein